VYDIPVREEGSGVKFPPEFLVDVEMLETFGLMYRIIKVAKFGERFQQKYQIRISGWGRAYFQRNLSNVQELLNLSNRLTEHFTQLIKSNQKEYDELFKKVREEPTSKETSQEARKISEKLPIMVIT
jgi:ABC-type oligopeptide transport system substrate-binding subunit